ncbi:GNAT family N-acetyltransferase [Glaciibacter flavus]|uniref:GNAT family N-acetyltransferase n=1 Tax=Orlajensenia flava TaxID=2565934 RepID=UPI003B00B234
MVVQVRPLVDRDFFPWLGLWEGYSAFYDSPVTDEKALRVWTWLMDKQHDLTGFVAHDGDDLLGLVHVREYPRTLDGDRALFLDDLFVDPDSRERGVGAALIEQAKSFARENGLSVINWITAEDNDNAQRLYDSVAERTTWVTYETPAIG